MLKRPLIAALLAAALGAASCGFAPISAPSEPLPVVSDGAADADLPASGTALAALNVLPVKGRAPKTGYDRDLFGPAWSDDVTVSGGHNGCDQRSDILRRDLSPYLLKPKTNGCVPLAGTLADPYTGQIIAFVRGPQTSTLVQIDHVAALSNLWQTGAQQLTPEERQDLANDPLNLLAVDGLTNQAKGDSDAATWLPPNTGFRCDYVARQVAVKAKYGLWVTEPEKTAMTQVLSNCPNQPLPAPAAVLIPEITP